MSALDQGHVDTLLRIEIKIQPPTSISPGVKTHKEQAFYDVDIPAVGKSALKPCHLTHHTDMDSLFIRPELQTKTQWLKAKLLPNPLCSSPYISIDYIGFL